MGARGSQAIVVAALACGCAGEQPGRSDATASQGDPSIGASIGESDGTGGIAEVGPGSVSADDDGSADATVAGGTMALFDVGGADDGATTGEMMDCAGAQHLVGTIRDFQIAHPDFEYTLGDDHGIVASTLGGDDKPVYAGMPSTPTTTGQTNFDQWYRDVAGVNMSADLGIDLTMQPDGTFSYDNQAFFPIDGMLWGNEGNAHNFHFTYELHTEFLYEGGEVFSFTGDDDLFVFVNDQLAIDLGGVHGAENGTIDFDAQAGALGLTVGQIYPLDFFFAERHTSESHFRIDTTIGCLVTVPPG